MATKEDKSADGAAAPKKSKKLLIIIIAVVVLLVAGGAGAFFVLHKSGDEGDDEVATEDAKPVKKKKAGKETPPVFVPFEAFTVNLVPEQGDQYLQLIISVDTPDEQTAEEVKAQTPKLRNKVMLLLSDKKASEILPKEGKEKLAVEIRDQMNLVLDPSAKPGYGPVREVLFTSFIVQ
ncbi:flagellar basal body protein FliL [Rhodocyclus tenuis]|uniref:Flagellar protein FliL n=2 Tax=Rhodocyclus TaxID=1064 RepID=A0A6L5JX38_RHOTE|nr:flagellar basal body-associated FliL family protein [Rhodocyclus gracilis]MQY51591.1 flagellar basal body protein FliL [Rhodocyclus gracilis]MRD73073.1 flagellar basal body protein FliL [Rhodocyclus gracilis]NJA89149.1 flagellar basal body protein FliL [Rhodocyclus gracilis]